MCFCILAYFTFLLSIANFEMHFPQFFGKNLKTIPRCKKKQKKKKNLKRVHFEAC